MILPAASLPLHRASGIPNALLGMALMLATEAMLFAALGSAYFVARSYAPAWPPPDLPRLPVFWTAANTLFLLASGVALWKALFSRDRLPVLARRLYLAAPLLGAVFVAGQGLEWTRLLRFGLSLQSGTFGGFFYLIVGMHALHAVAGVVALAVTPLFTGPRGLSAPAVKAAGLYWLFVVALWPVLYLTVYWL